MPEKQTPGMSTETTPQVLFGKEALNTSTEISSGESTLCGTACENHLTAAQTKAFIVNQMKKTEEQLASIMSKEALRKQTF